MITYALLKVIAYSLTLYSVGLLAYAAYLHKQEQPQTEEED